ncbi:MAG TPA: hypothetical protein VG320_18450 [Paraburkholderia sp.]|jgi:hypothetical protein|nr:hypothetical protein [Paraburkholderia sp.]
MSSSLLPVITVFEHSPDRGKGLARDMRAFAAQLALFTGQSSTGQ